MQLSNTWKATVGLMIGAILCLPAQAAAEKKIIMRYSHSSAAMVEEPHHTAALDFKKYVNSCRVRPLPSMSSIFLPFRTNQEGWAILDKYWDELNAKTIKESGNRIIGWLDLGYRHVCNSKRPIRTIEDLKGLKIRVPNNPVMINTFRAWGCEPTPLAWDETFNALQQKVVDGQENSYVVFASNKFEEVQKYMTELRYKLQIIVMVVNDTWLKKQPADIQQAILEGGRLATKHNREMIMAMEARLKPAMKKAGVEILDKPEDENVWEEKAMALWPDHYPKIGNLALLDKMMADLHRKRP
ncbi:MAG: TRAP transporter substrate-binding protein [Bilophila wadsworthia]